MIERSKHWKAKTILIPTHLVMWCQNICKAKIGRTKTRNELIHIGDLNLFPSVTGKEQKHTNIFMNTEYWKNTINKLNITYIYSISYPIYLPKLTVC